MSGVWVSPRRHHASVPTDLEESRLSVADLAVLAQQAADRVQVAAMIARTYGPNSEVSKMLGVEK